MSAVSNELHRYSKDHRFLNRKVRTVFFGGGTPSLIAPAGIGEFLNQLSVAFPGSHFDEVTLEANPGGVTLERLNGYREAGVSRLSFGAQSLNPDTLKILGRIHTRDDIEKSVENARKAGFRNISADLIFGVPDQSFASFERDVADMLNLQTDHISAYGLTYEKGTPFFQSVARGALIPLGDDATADMYELLLDSLPGHGLQQYEISNFARPEKQSLHNLAYWNCDDYLGLGVGAHSYVASYENKRRTNADRWANLAEATRYMSAIESQESVVSWSESLRTRELEFERLFVGLRRMAGVSIETFRAEFETSLQDRFEAQLKSLSEGGLLLIENGHLKLTRKGLLLSDSVLESFVG